LQRRGDLFILLRLSAESRLIAILAESAPSRRKKRVMENNDNGMCMGAVSP
jgi:hypothetical protein